jgi:peptide deformylase
MVRITQEGETVLRETAQEVPLDEITSPHIQKVIADMKEALASQEDGVAIAAPQIGVSLCIFIVSRRVFVLDDEGRLLPHMQPQDAQKYNDIVYINPKVIKTSSKKHWVPEGCLSVRGICGKTRRSEKATVEAYDENGNKFTRGGSGLLAQIFQHETDHLRGVLFIDHAKDMEEYVTPENAD